MAHALRLGHLHADQHSGRNARRPCDGSLPDPLSEDDPGLSAAALHHPAGGVGHLGMMIFFGEMRILGQLWPVGVALCVINLPFMIWSVSASVNALDPRTGERRLQLWRTAVQAFFTVTLPAVMPGVITGALLMFILAFNEFLVSLFLTDSRTVTLPVQIYNSIRSVITPDLAAVSVLYIVIALLAVWALDRLVGLEIFLDAFENEAQEPERCWTSPSPSTNSRRSRCRTAGRIAATGRGRYRAVCRQGPADRRCSPGGGRRGARPLCPRTSTRRRLQADAIAATPPTSTPHSTRWTRR